MPTKNSPIRLSKPEVTQKSFVPTSIETGFYANGEQKPNLSKIIDSTGGYTDARD